MNLIIPFDNINYACEAVNNNYKRQISEHDNIEKVKGIILNEIQTVGKGKGNPQVLQNSNISCSALLFPPNVPCSALRVLH